MIPGKALVTPPIWSPFQSPANIIPYNPFVSLSPGGIGVSNPAGGLRYQTWTLTLVGSPFPYQFYLSAPNTPSYLLYQLSPGTYASSCSLGFDQNMKPAIGYVTDEGAFLWWYNSVVSGYQVLPLGSSMTSVQLALDDTRPPEVSSSDLICAFTDVNNLYYRQERDAFGTQYTLALPVGIPTPLIQKVGMNTNWRLQFYIQGSIYS